MPSKLKAGGTFPYVLECDREDDPGSVFHLNILSCAEEEELLDARERYFEASGDKAKQRELTLVMLGIAVKSFDVKGQEGKELKTFLTDRECFELVEKNSCRRSHPMRQNLPTMLRLRVRRPNKRERASEVGMPDMRRARV